MAKAAVVTGVPELDAKLKELKGPKAKEAVRKSTREALRPVADQVKATAPRRTGRLSRSVKVRSLKRSRVRVGSRVTVSGTASNFKGRGFYGGFIEFGWKAGRRVRNVDLGLERGAKRSAAHRATAEARNNSRKQVPATNWMKKAAQAKRQAALGIFRAETRRWIREFSKAK